MDAGAVQPEVRQAVAQRRVGRSGLVVSRLGLGTGTWGTETDAIDAGELLATFAAAGGTLVDCAPHYGDGQAEEMLGALLTKSFRRDEFVLATKAGLRRVGGRTVPDASRRNLLETLDSSLARLDTDHVDLWQVQLFDAATPIEETLSALEHAVTSGRARYVGVANHAGWQLARAATLLEATSGHARIVAAGAEYSLLNRSAEAELLPAAAATGVGLLAHAPLAGGVLTGKYRHTTPRDSRAARTDHLEHHLEPAARRVVDAVATAAQGLGVSPAEVALAWVRDRTGVAAAVVGARTVAQLAPSLAAEALVLPEGIRRALADVSG